MKIAIIGSGISGLTCAYLLNRQHDITIFESSDSVGGHTATKDVNVNGQHYAIDTGFIVYNDWTYPNFIKLLDELKVVTQPTDMSFSVHCESSGLEYGGSHLNTLFAQRRNLFKPRYWQMLRDILRFNKESIADLELEKVDPDSTLGDYLHKQHYSSAFIQDYLIPMGSAIWSASTQTMLNFPLLFFIRFFKNHGLLSVNHRPQWRVISGGSKCYLTPLKESFKEKIKTSCRVDTVTRSEKGVTINAKGCEPESFDQVVFACHSDQALAMLAHPSIEEQRLLSAIPYQNNDVVLHTDTQLLPKRKLAWSSWNYLKASNNQTAQQQASAILTYNMNILQGIVAPETFCVTLNATDKIDATKILGRYQYAHPVFSLASEAAVKNWYTINGINRTWFCGAYWGNGFHEDGVNSALRVTEALGVPW
ncbi:FAD-dependent oxidoreductase [Candidatus Endobugula sertula]|uniref:FAD-dependent oxidoreductase n=1 Tax=Candidatus Endobugula sertula TaxID=62101 RepID=A0A1D2QMG5_9GAMM|nr:FAD-dependent oxidoreductase [Candidatus Endobugula sertula]